MKIVIAGGSGHLGMILARAFAASGHEVVILSRKVGTTEIRTVVWDGQTLGAWATELGGADVVINLAGRSVNCRYDATNRALIKQSRIRSTKVLGAAIQLASQPPGVWLQSSTATIYADRYDFANDESTGILGTQHDDVPATWKFSHDVAASWEETAASVRLPETRLVLMRTAIVMSPDQGGAFSMLRRLARWGLGGKQGNGKQFVSWIHECDFIRAVDWLIEHEEIEGPVNLAAPTPLTNAKFMSELRNACGSKLGLPAFTWMLELGTFALRTESELVLKSRRVEPGRLLEQGFEFRFPNWSKAAYELCQRSSHGKHRSIVAVLSEVGG